MASPGGISSGSSSILQNSSSEEEIQIQIMDERKRKRMISNRDSARRSRMRKQKHLDDLLIEVSNLRKIKDQILNNVNITTQNYLKVEAENSVLRAQVLELNNRLQSLNEITNVLSVASNNNHNMGVYGGDQRKEMMFPMIQEPFGSDLSLLMNPWSFSTCLNQPIIASANMFQYY